MNDPAIADYTRRSHDQSPTMISIVTTVRNAERTLQRTIDSVRAQAMPDIEYIIVDARSTDRTLDIVRANADTVTHWISEEDQGISDGFNKGIALSRGKYVLLLNADDWLSAGQIALSIETLEKTGAAFVFGDLIYHAESGKEMHRIRGEAGYADRIGHIMPGLNHPTVIVRRTVYENLGLFDLNFRLAMDYELLLRFHRAGCIGIYDPRVVGHMALDGASDRNAGIALREVRQASIRHGHPVIIAWLRYVWRFFKWKSHMALAGMPRPVYVWLRRHFNRNYIARP